MKQKVRFILHSRGLQSGAIAAGEDSARVIDELVGQFARSVYDQGSLATHVGASRARVLQLKQYVEVVLADLLALT